MSLYLMKLKQCVLKMMNDNFAVFILSHGRAGNIKTLKTLKHHGYTGKTYIIIDDFDDTADEYYKKHGAENIIQFDKKEMAEETDTMDNFHDMRVVVYARNYTFKIAKELGLKYFLVLDDDYISFVYRFIEDNKLMGKDIKNLDKLFAYMVEFLEKTNALTVAMTQGGDFLGGAKGGIAQGPPKRKAMNTFFCKTDRPFEFKGTINEDTNAYTLLGSQGGIFFQVKECTVDQTTTQQNEGGLTDIYLDVGTYVKSFYSVLAMPSSVTIRNMGQNHRRLHHSVNWNNTVPKMIDEKYKKKGG